MSATHILLPQQPNLNVIERKFKRQILMPDPIILDSKYILKAFPFESTDGRWQQRFFVQVSNDIQ